MLINTTMVDLPNIVMLNLGLTGYSISFFFGTIFRLIYVRLGDRHTGICLTVRGSPQVNQLLTVSNDLKFTYAIKPCN